MPSRFNEFVEGLNPAFFAIVMATGIVSLAVRLHGQSAIAMGLTALNLVIFALLLTFSLLRLARNPGQIKRDSSDPKRAFGFFTTVAGANVLGVQALVVLRSPILAASLWVFGAALWLVLTYSVLAGVVSSLEKPEWTGALNGTWLLLVVATQSCAVTGIQLHPTDSNVFLLCLFWFLSGCFLYVILITLIFYRLTLFPLDRRDMTPPYWINMGALSISTLAGAKLLGAPVLNGEAFASLTPFLTGLTVALWCFATWWIPLLVALWLWRHGPAGLPMSYNAQIWAMVFPLGMYAVCTQGVAGIVKVPAVDAISVAFAWIAPATWLICFVGLARHVVRELAPPSNSAGKGV